MTDMTDMTDNDRTSIDLLFCFSLCFPLLGKSVMSVMPWVYMVYSDTLETTRKCMEPQRKALAP
jgi:hypothetical protein